MFNGVKTNSKELIQKHNKSAEQDFPDRKDPRADHNHPLHDIVCGWCGKVHNNS